MWTVSFSQATTAAREVNRLNLLSFHNTVRLLNRVDIGLQCTPAVKLEQLALGFLEEH
jgi:hypothetical protein